MTFRPAHLMPLAVLPFLAAPADALPFVSVNAGAYGALALTKPASASSIGLDVDAHVSVPLLDASVHAMTLGDGAYLGEVGLRNTISLLDMVVLDTGIGYQGNSLFTGTLDHAPMASAVLRIQPPLLPVTADVEAIASYPLGLGKLVVGYSADVNLFPIPLLPVGISAKYRSYGLDYGSQTLVSTGLIGLRAKL